MSMFLKIIVTCFLAYYLEKKDERMNFATKDVAVGTSSIKRDLRPHLGGGHGHGVSSAYFTGLDEHESEHLGILAVKAAFLTPTRLTSFAARHLLPIHFSSVPKFSLLILQ